MSCNKLYYFVHLDADNRPIPDTMFSKKQARSNPCSTKIAPVTGLPMTPPAGWQACTKNPSGLRYWYQITTFIPAGGTPQPVILPNSMIAVRGVPKPLARHGTGGRPCQYMEFKVFEPIGFVDHQPFQNLISGVSS